MMIRIQRIILELMSIMQRESLRDYVEGIRICLEPLVDTHRCLIRQHARGVGDRREMSRKPLKMMKVNLNSMSRECCVDGKSRWMRKNIGQRILVSHWNNAKLIIGVVFENLSVYGMGGVKHFVKTFPDAFVDFFNVYGTVMNLIGKKTGTETAILRDFNGIVKPGEVIQQSGYTNNRCCLSS